ncbi:hypothetical protein [Anthocerotibacter panamensis]|uniref:hypothetical protein n=1 Tax=Anthocerotibacter panamensis TaxID=2857077 RepID=UPI001C404D65|nr:hypothetical protein [Anthocerotibacter panamensis]
MRKGFYLFFLFGLGAHSLQAQTFYGSPDLVDVDQIVTSLSQPVNVGATTTNSIGTYSASTRLWLTTQDQDTQPVHAAGCSDAQTNRLVDVGIPGQLGIAGSSCFTLSDNPEVVREVVVTQDVAGRLAVSRGSTLVATVSSLLNAAEAKSGVVLPTGSLVVGQFPTPPAPWLTWEMITDRGGHYPLTLQGNSLVATLPSSTRAAQFALAFQSNSLYQGVALGADVVIGGQTVALAGMPANFPLPQGLTTLSFATAPVLSLVPKRPLLQVVPSCLSVVCPNGTSLQLTVSYEGLDPATLRLFVAGQPYSLVSNVAAQAVAGQTTYDLGTLVPSSTAALTLVVSGTALQGGTVSQTILVGAST